MNPTQCVNDDPAHESILRSEFFFLLSFATQNPQYSPLKEIDSSFVQLQQSYEFVKNYPQCLHASVVVELVPVIKFLRGLDVEKQDIGYVLMKYPELLGFKLEGTMSTSVAYLVSIGVNPRDVGPMVTQYPYFLGMRVGTTIKPLVDYLVSWIAQKYCFARVLEKMPQIVSLHQHVIMKPNISSSCTGIFNSECGKDDCKMSSTISHIAWNRESNPDTRGCRARESDVLWLGFLTSDQRFEERLYGDYIEPESSGPSFCMGGKLELPGNEIVSEEEEDSDDETLYRRTVSLWGNL
ncbi:hypothetical protein HAX54_009992 [Datura stramonium]|uniref:Uncharacterized protein n=1 Tax=Datura stramonium TaxID=4076 RepID=A0ABS8THF2_DATST|nr:hypothetical protein [Datura stramonium]